MLTPLFMNFRTIAHTPSLLKTHITREVALFAICVSLSMPAFAAPESTPLFQETGTGWDLEYSPIYFDDFSTATRVLKPASVLGEGGVLETSDPLEGTASILGSSNGSQQYLNYFHTESAILPLRGGSNYHLSFSYRIVESGDKGFETIFYSPTGGSQNRWIPGVVVHGAEGSSGVAELDATLFDYPDYCVWFNVVNKGSIIIDSIEVRESGQVVYSEDFESVSNGPGPGLVLANSSLNGDDGLLLAKGATLRSNTEILALPLMSIFRISFDYRVISPTIHDRSLDLKLIPTPTSEDTILLRPLLRNAPERGHFSAGFSTGSAGPYAFSITAGQNAHVLIDNLKLEKGTPRLFTSEPPVYAYLANAPFPRLGNCNQILPFSQATWGGFEGTPWKNSVEAIERRLALYDLIFGFNGPMEECDPDFPTRIRKLNPNAVLLPYVIAQESMPYIHKLATETPDPNCNLQYRYDLGISPEWYVNDISGVPVNDLGYPGILKMDISPYCPRVEGKTFLEYEIDGFKREYIGSGIWDGLFIDNLFARMNPHIPSAWIPEKLDFDINRNAIMDENPAMLNRISYNSERVLLEGLIAGIGNRELILGNNGQLPETRFSPYVNGYLFEGYNTFWDSAGNEKDEYSELRWRRALDDYLLANRTSRYPCINVIEAMGVQSGKIEDYGRAEPTSDDVQRNRFALGTALLGDAFYEYDLTEARSAATWFDEFAVGPDGVAQESAAGKGYLGKALGSAVELTSPAKIIWQNDFEKWWNSSIDGREGSYISRRANEIIDGKKSAVIEGKQRKADTWAAFETNTSFNLKKGKSYTVEFSWKVLEDLDYGIWFSIRSEGFDTGTPLNAMFAGETGRAHFHFTPPENNAYSLRISMLSKGKVAVDNFKVMEGGTGPWRRDFENGIVLVNPFPIAYTFDSRALAGALNRTGLRRLKGTQAPEVNTGAPVGNSLVLGPFDAIILLADRMDAH